MGRSQFQVPEPEQKEKSRPNRTGIPEGMKREFERRSGLSFDDVRVHYNSERPSRMEALAYTRGTEVYMGPGQEMHLPHELGHVVQQKQGRVKATGRIGNVPVNTSPALEREADTCRELFAGPAARGTGSAPIQFLNEDLKFRKNTGQPENETPGSGRNVRPPAVAYSRPVSEEVLSGANSGAYSGYAYHHIVSFHTLAGFWDSMVERARETGNVDDLRSIMRKVVSVYKAQLKKNDPRVSGRRIPSETMLPAGADAASSFLLPSGERAVTIEELEAFVENFSLDDFQEEGEEGNVCRDCLNLIAEMYTWLPFNLVLGPERGVLDPGETFDYAAALVRKETELYIMLNSLMRDYQKGDNDSDSANIIQSIAWIFEMLAGEPIYDRENPEKAFDIADHRVLDDCVKILKSISDTLTEKIRNAATGKKALSKKKSDTDNALQTHDNALKKGKINAKAIQTIRSLAMEDIKEFQRLVMEGSSDRPPREAGMAGAASSGDGDAEAVFHTSASEFSDQYIAEYGGDAGNNCFFYALAALGFRMPGTADGTEEHVAAMRNAMDILQTGNPSYRHEGMIEDTDAAAFAHQMGIRIQFHALRGTEVFHMPFVGPPDAEPVYHILHIGLHFMPLFPRVSETQE